MQKMAGELDPRGKGKKFDKNGKPSLLQKWINDRRNAGLAGAPILYPNPQDNLLVGLEAIMHYLGIKSNVSFHMWVEMYGLPAMKRPDGLWMSSMTAIDQWIFMASEIDLSKRVYPRGLNARLESARKRIDRALARNRRQQEEAEAALQASSDQGPTPVQS